MCHRPLLDRSVFLRPIAHRGLHDAGMGRIENTAPAFEAAIAHGYGIECDLRPLADGTPIVFHDETLTRLVDGTSFVTSLTPGDLTQLRYRNSHTPILTFEALLTLVNGAVPLLVEIKSEWSPPDPNFLTQIAALARAYRGAIALMSFDPTVISSLRSLAPEIPRGLVSGSYDSNAGDHWWHDKLTATRAANLRDLADFALLGCSFAAYECAALPMPATQTLRSAGLPVFTWTVRSHADRAHAALHADAMIFEGFLP